MKRLALGLVLVATAVLPALADPPRLTNGTLVTRSASGGLETAVQALVRAGDAPRWIGWSVASDRPRESCCYECRHGGNCCPGCRLEGDASTSGPRQTAPGVVRLEGDPTLLVLLRAENGVITKIKQVSGECPLDGGGTTLFFLSDAKSAESLRFLATLVAASGERTEQRLADQALATLAMHADPMALDILIDRARTGATVHLRGQALFWLAQRAGDRAVATIARAIEDPATEVKKKAVFALSQLPKDEGVPLLIQQARANKNAAVRKQAFFWLGQSKDPRALRFLEEVLK